MANDFPLSVIIRAVDQATGPLRRVSERIQRFTAPVRKLGNSFKAMSQAAGLDRLVTGFANVGRGIGAVGREVGAVALRITAAIGAAGFAVFRLVQGTAEAGDTLAKTAKRVGLTTQAYAELEFAAKRAGISQTEFATATDQFNRRLGELKAGKGEMLSFFQLVSPQLAEQLRLAKNNEEAMNLMFRAIERLEDPAKRAVVAYTAFGRAGTKMVNIVEGGTAGVAELRAEFRRLAGDQTEFGRRSEIISDAWDDITTAFEGAKRAAITELMPALTGLVQSVTEMFVANREEIRLWAREFARELPGRIRELVAGFKQMREQMQPLFRFVQGLADRFGGLNVALAAIAAVVLGPLLASIASLVVAFIGLGAVMLTTPVGWFLLAIAAIVAAGYVLIKAWGPIKQFFADLWDGVTGAFEKAWDTIRPIVDGLKKAMEFTPIGLALRGINAAAGLFTGAAARPALGADQTRAGAFGGRQSEAHVTVDFNNLPQGARVTSDPRGTADLDLGMGYTMMEAR